MLRTSVSSVRRRIATSWRPACITTSTSGSASTRASGEKSRVALERVEHLGAHPPSADGIGHRHLHEAEQRLVAALGHELRVDCDPPSLGGAVASSAITGADPSAVAILGRVALSAFVAGLAAARRGGRPGPRADAGVGD